MNRSKSYTTTAVHSDAIKEFFFPGFALESPLPRTKKGLAIAYSRGTVHASSLISRVPPDGPPPSGCVVQRYGYVWPPNDAER